MRKDALTRAEPQVKISMGERGGIPFAAADSRVRRPFWAAVPLLSRRQGWLLLAVWTGAWTAWDDRVGGYSWHYFRDGAWLLSHPSVPGGGLHLYASHPQLQIGPLALLVAVPGQLLPRQVTLLLAELALAALGLGLLRTLEQAGARLTQGAVPLPLLMAVGVVLIPVWSAVAVHYTHLDDALAMAFGVLALRALVAQRPMLMALALAAAADAKPWAVGFVVLLAALPARDRRRAALTTAAAVEAMWLPFVIADPQTLMIGRFTIETAADSGLHALGVNDPATPPWDRPAQVILGVLVAYLAVRGRRWPQVLLAVIAARMLLDPQTYPYYGSGLLVAAAAADLLQRRRTLPVWTLASGGWVALDAARPEPSSRTRCTAWPAPSSASPPCSPSAGPPPDTETPRPPPARLGGKCRTTGRLPTRRRPPPPSVHRHHKPAAVRDAGRPGPPPANAARSGE